jgi:hypothetical protein
MFDGGCIFVDHASGYVHVEFQTTLNSHETLQAKERYELMCRDVGVIPQAYLSDNGSAFASADFARHLSSFQQTMRFAGAGAHHHNAVAERSIRTIMSVARTMMLHAAIHWPDVADSCLWPMAVAHAVFLHNHVPNPSTGISPIDIFTKTRWEQRKLHDLHVWGCPVYVLDKTLSDGKKLPRWKPRSRRSINMGQSPKHASTVPLVLNPESGAITAQFHVVFDDWFATVASSEEDLPDFQSPEWSQLFGDSIYQYPFDDYDADPAPQDSGPGQDARQNAVAKAMDRLAPPTPLPASPQVPQPVLPLLESRTLPSPIRTNQSESAPVPAHPPPSLLTPTSDTRETPSLHWREPQPPQQPPTAPQREKPPTTPASTVSHQQRTTRSKAKSPQTKLQPVSDVPRRSSRTTKGTFTSARHGYDGDQGHGYLACTAAQARLFPEFVSEPTPYSYKAKSSDPNTLTYEQALLDSEHSEEWRASMIKEIRELESKGTWVEVDKSQAKDRIIPCTWVMRIKTTPDGTPYKRKSRVCLRGDVMPDNLDTFAPVVAWSSVRLFLVLALAMDWHTTTIDFSNAFVQAKIDKPVWMHVPRGFRSTRGPNTCLELKKSIYGHSRAPRMWFEHLTANLLEMGFRQAEHDACFLYRGDMLLVQYVDDIGAAAAKQETIDVFVDELKRRGFELTCEGTFSAFLGIQFDKDPTSGAITMTQKGLIKKIIEITGMQDSNPNWLPAPMEALGIDPDGEPMSETWSYPSVVGMLLYLTTNTRLDCCFAVSQIARFTHAPKQSHASAVKTLVRYLKRTADKGLIVRPSGDLKLQMWADADFAGLHRRDPDNEPSSAKSRTGYIITLADCPLIWKSHLQSHISLGTAEAEYSACSSALRTLLPLRNLLLEVARALNLPANTQASVHTATVHQDNAAALQLATEHRITNRTKYFHTKWHWFWNFVKSGVLKLVKAPTEAMAADYLTKQQPRAIFERNRLQVQGW